MVKVPAYVIKNHAITGNVVKYIKKKPSDIVIFDGYGTIPNMLGMLYMTFRKNRFFVNVDGVTLDSKETKIKRMIKKVLFSKYAYFLCSSDYTEKWIQSFGVSKEHTISHNFSSLHEYDILDHTPTCKERAEMRAKLGLRDVPTIIAVGRFLKLKQFDKLIEAYRFYDSNAQLLIIGEGSEKKIYKELILRYQLKNVYILDFMEFERLKNYYVAADILVLPSYSEVWGLVVNEGMGCGAVPVIVSDRCVVAYSLVEDGVTGYRYQYNDIDDLKNKLGILINDPELRKKMSWAVLKRISKYTIENTAKIHLEWFKMLN
jgi:glycosyltransferase involved in cell wall biosynthesis